MANHLFLFQFLCGSCIRTVWFSLALCWSSQNKLCWCQFSSPVRFFCEYRSLLAKLSWKWKHFPGMRAPIFFDHILKNNYLHYPSLKAELCLSNRKIWLSFPKFVFFSKIWILGGNGSAKKLTDCVISVVMTIICIHLYSVWMIMVFHETSLFLSLFYKQIERHLPYAGKQRLEWVYLFKDRRMVN